MGVRSVEGRETAAGVCRWQGGVATGIHRPGTSCPQTCSRSRPCSWGLPSCSSPPQSSTANIKTLFVPLTCGVIDCTYDGLHCTSCARGSCSLSSIPRRTCGAGSIHCSRPDFLRQHTHSHQNLMGRKGRIRTCLQSVIGENGCSFLMSSRPHVGVLGYQLSKLQNAPKASTLLCIFQVVPRLPGMTTTQTTLMLFLYVASYSTIPRVVHHHLIWKLEAVVFRRRHSSHSHRGTSSPSVSSCFKF